MTAAETKLKSEMGDKYDTNVELAKRMHQKHLGTEFDKDFSSATPEQRFGMTRLLLKIAFSRRDRSPGRARTGNLQAQRHGLPQLQYASGSISI